MNPQQKRVAAIHDISGVGKCSLTVALPILSAAGCEAAVIPTALLSTHTAAFEGYTYRDLTDEMLPIARHWQKSGLKFDAIYSGFLGSSAQVQIVCDIIGIIGGENTLTLIDPAMADNGRLYSTFDSGFPRVMKKLAAKADILTPNITEICLLTDSEYKVGPYDERYITQLLEKAADLGCKNIVLTGVYFDDKNLGCAAYDCENGSIDYIFSDKQSGFYHGTGDIFASALVSGMMNGFDLKSSAKIACDFVAQSIIETNLQPKPNEYGVNFESALPCLMKSLNII